MVTTNTNDIVKKETLWVTNDEMKTFNKYFKETVEKINIFAWPLNNEDLTKETLTKIIKKYKNHPSIGKIKSQYLIKKDFFFNKIS